MQLASASEIDWRQIEELFSLASTVNTSRSTGNSVLRHKQFICSNVLLCFCFVVVVVVVVDVPHSYSYKPSAVLAKRTAALHAHSIAMHLASE